MKHANWQDLTKLFRHKYMYIYICRNINPLETSALSELSSNNFIKQNYKKEMQCAEEIPPPF